MAQQRWVLFFLAASISSLQAQISDDFSIPGDNLSAIWQGALDDFEISEEGTLILAEGAQSTSEIYTTFLFDSILSYSILLNMDFNPSNQNRQEIYLWSDGIITDGVDALILRIGENGSTDALTLIQQSGTTREVIATGTIGLVSNGPIGLRLDILIEENIVTIAADITGRQCFEEEISTVIEPPQLGQVVYFGWQALYTTSRRDKFEWDDFYLGPPRIDSVPPTVVNLTVQTNQAIVSFDESVDPSSLATSTISVLPAVSDLMIDLDKNEGLQLSTVNGWEEGIDYTLVVNGIQDLSANTLDTSLQFSIPFSPQPGDILINEILFNPLGSGSDFLEIVNVSDRFLSLDNLVLSNTLNGQEIILANLPLLAPQEIRVFCSDRQNIISTYPSNNVDQIFEIDIPRWNNDFGNITLSIRDQIIDVFDYDEDFHNVLLDDIDGVSLERISQVASTNLAENWTSASPGVGFGTPGLINSAADSSSGSSFNSIEPSFTVFTPDGDGVRDFLLLDYSFDLSGYIGSVEIYTESGQLIRRLVNQDLLSRSGTLEWDGLDDSSSMSPQGLYIIRAEFFHPSGAVFGRQIAIGLGRR
jgi:hypothetical protein